MIQGKYGTSNPEDDVNQESEFANSVHFAASVCSLIRDMPSPSAFLKFGSSILKFFKHAQFFMYTYLLKIILVYSS